MEKGKDRVALPSVHRAEEVHLAVGRTVWAELSSRLMADAPNEACAFVLARPSFGILRTTVILGAIIWPREGDVEATRQRLEISAEYITRAMDAAADAGPLVGLCLVHTHRDTDWGEGIAEFSPRDDWYEQRLLGDNQQCVGDV
jgi:hypothetical protein